MINAEHLRNKATAIILANQAKNSGNKEEAKRQFLIAAPLEEEMFESLAADGRHDYIINVISAVWCWFHAGEYQQALLAGQRGRALLTDKVALSWVEELDALILMIQNKVDEKF